MRLLYTSGGTSDDAKTHHLHMTEAECDALHELLGAVDMNKLTELYVDRMTRNTSGTADDRDTIKGLLEQYHTLVLAHARATVILNNG